MSSDSQHKGSKMVAENPRTNNSEHTVCSASHSKSMSEVENFRRTKYHDIVCPRVKAPQYQHVVILKYRKEGLNGGGDAIIIPQNIGRHVIDEDYRAPRAAPLFKHLRPQDLFFPLTSLKEWKKLEEEGIEATDVLLTVGEILLAEDEKSRKWMCKPSPLRSSWTYT
ncbi:hypothetical protein N431DRAFT_456151 [Stipitochalara longipes BDJ]|nr:hypothetical protein N431DRAFT_456151 [Stipitochalara longipes BDJ]